MEAAPVPPSKPEPVQAEKPELRAPLSVPKDIAKIVDTAPPSGASGARSGVVGGATTGLPGVSVGDVFSTAAWRCGSGALLTDNGGGGGGGDMYRVVKS